MDLTTTDLEILDLDRRRATLQSALAVLVGDTASAFQMNPQGSWNAVLPGIPPGVPAGVLARRPDLMAGLNAMLAAAARVGASEVSSLPSLTLNGSVGHASPDLDQLFLLSNRAWGLGALLALPLFDGGQRDATMGAASAELSIARAEYRAQFLGAFKDVEDNLSALRLLDNHAKQQTNAVASANRGVRLTSSRYRNGLASMLEVLESQRIEVRTQRREIQVRSAQFQSTVSLIKALGGGWE
jgi:multidrug efflux system outer membrane protein